MPIETEIKFRVSDLAALAQRLQSAGFRCETPRNFESNVLYDTPDRQLRARTEILRIRSYAGRGTLTQKRLPGSPVTGLRHRGGAPARTAISIASKPKLGSPTATRSPNFFFLLDSFLHSDTRSGARSGPMAKGTA